MSSQLNADRARIFLSFADEDRARAMELVRWLNDGGWHIVADERHAFASDPRRPSRHLDDCDVALCVVTPGWLVSSHCHRELSYCTAKGKLILPVMCEEIALGLLPSALRALPRIDLTHHGVIDYLALKQTLTQAGSGIVRGGAARAGSGRVACAWCARARRRAAAAALLALAILAAAAWRWW
jgi:hypothetical protein